MQSNTSSAVILKTPTTPDKEVANYLAYEWNKRYKYKKIYQSNTTKLYYVYYCIRAKCFDSYRTIFRPF